MKATTLRDVMAGNRTAEISCLYTGKVVRRLKRVGDQLEVDALDVVVTVPLDTPLTYKPWVMDRGNMLFDVPGHQGAKFCGEGDHITYPDGTRDVIEPNDEQRMNNVPDPPMFMF